MPLKLRIELLSPLCAGSGLSRPGVVDREISFDETGLPYIPGKTLKGLLRDSLTELRQSPVFTGLEKPNRVLGEIGASESGPLSIRSARLTCAADLAPWLKQVQQHHRRAIAKQDVIDYFTEIRRQTAIDPERGAPKRDSLRSTRLVRTGSDMVFEAEVDGLETEALRDSVALSAAALQFMGTSRSRGFGNVHCSLWDGIANLTDVAIHKLEHDPLAFAKTTATASQQPGASPPDPDAKLTPAVPTHALPFTLELREPLLCPTQEGDQNIAITALNVPGSAIRGALATRAIKAGRTKDFYRLFCSGAVQFLSANPVSEDGQRCLPVRHSIRENKETGELIDLTRMTDDDEPPPIRRFLGWTNGTSRVEVDVRYQFHHARAKDRRAGRALGEKAGFYGLDPATEGGAVFTYQSIEAGQRLDGEILGSENDLKDIQSFLNSGDIVRFGRSRSAQYGGAAQWTWRTPVPLMPEVDNNLDQRIAVVLTAPLIGRNEHGHSVPEFPVSDFATNLGLSRDKIEIEKSFLRLERVSGYLSHQRLARQQETALAAGTTFLVKVREQPASGKFNDAQKASYGVRIEDGFGRIAIRTPLEAGFTLRSEQRTPPPSPDLTAGAPQAALAKGIFGRQFLSRAAHSGLAQETTLGNATSSLLNRILRLVETVGLDDLASNIGQLRKPARERLANTRIGGVSFLDYVIGRQWEASVASLLAATRNNWGDLKDPLTVDSRVIADAHLDFMRNVIRAMLWRIRKERIEEQRNG